MNMQNKQYTIQFFSPLDNWLRSLSPSSGCGTRRTHGAHRSLPPVNPHLDTEHDICGMEYFHWPAWATCLAMLPPNSCTPAC